ncbi:MAG: ROK family protein [Saprospiraceae bacterium]
MNKQLALGIDLGGTNIKAVLTNAKGAILEERSEPTHDKAGIDNSAEWKQTIKTMVEAFSAKTAGKIETIGISAPGTANPDNTAILSMPNKLLGIEKFIWKDHLGREAYVLNDAHAALFAESRIGVGKGCGNILLVTLGTGVGGGIMIDGKLLQGQKGRAGHVGHISVNQGASMSIVNAPGSLERAIGEHTIAHRTYGRFASTKDLVGAHLRGETFATWVWLKSLESLARGLVSMINSISPELIILGGGITQADQALLQPLKAFMEIYEWPLDGFRTPIKLAQLGTLAGAVGAALFALEKKK